jgi:hypothetical protein
MMIINPFINKPAHIIPPYVKILMPLNSVDGFTDIANNHAITVVGSPTISTAQSKFGSGALRVSSGSYLRIATTPTLELGNRNVLTVECWAYITRNGGIFSTRTLSNYTNFSVKRDYTLIGKAALNDWFFINATPPMNQWVHIALVLDGTNIKEYINGVQTAEIVAHPLWPSGNHFLNIGSDHDGVIDGYINDLRISDTAVYTSDFTPPTSPF